MARPAVWGAATVVALIGASQWLVDPAVEYLALVAGATVASAAALRSDRASGWRWRIGPVVLLAVVLAAMIPVQRRLHAVDTRWEEWRAGVAADGARTLQAALDDAVRHAMESVDAAIAAPRDRERAFATLERATKTRYESGAILIAGDSALAWGGQFRLPARGAPPGLDVVSSPFYLAVRVTRVVGDRRATVMVLVDAAPPGDRIARSLASLAARRSGLTGFEFRSPDVTTPDSVASRPDVLSYRTNGARLFDAWAIQPEQGSTRLAIVERARLVVGLLLALALIGFIIAEWRRSRALWVRFAALGVALICSAIVPLNQYSNLSRLFYPAVYHAANGHQLTANAAALALTSAIVLSGIILVVRRRRARINRIAGATTVLLVAGLGPFLLRNLARGIHIPETGVDSSLWLIWEIPLFLAAVSVLLAGAAASSALGRARIVPQWVGPALATVGAVLAPTVWEAPGRWPGWYVLLWIAAIGALALSRGKRMTVAGAATVAALGAVTLVWGQTARGRVELAEADLRSLNTTDTFLAEQLLPRFAALLARVPAPRTTQELLQLYVRSDLAPAAYPAKLYSWSGDDRPFDSLETVPRFVVSHDAVSRVVAEAKAARAPVVREFASWPGQQVIMAAPASDGGMTVVAAAPKSRLYPVSPFAQLRGIEGSTSQEPLYVLRQSSFPSDSSSGEAMTWRRTGSELHGDWVGPPGPGLRSAHVEVDLRPVWVLVQRGGLIVLVDLALVGILWLAAVVADGSASRWLRARRRTFTRSYRARLSFAMFGFFAIPAMAFVLWSNQQLASEARTVRQVLVSQTLRAAQPSGGAREWVPAESRRLKTTLLLFFDGELDVASDPLIETLAPLGRLLDREVFTKLAPRDEVMANRFEQVADARVLVGYRPIIGFTTRPVQMILAAPSGTEEYFIDARQRDLGILVLFTSAVGALAAFWLSGIAARQLARPIGSLRSAALAIAGGERSPLIDDVQPTEFRPVFAAFREMAENLNASRTALEEAQRRTAAVLRNVATGVVAVTPEGMIALANPRAEALVGTLLSAGASIDRALPDAVVSRIRGFLAGDDDDAAFETEWQGRQLRGNLTRLSRGGAVVTMDDVTELARAQRVLAWGEMARQIAHEIKNPLTPIRLGVQHLRRARTDRRVDFDAVLDRNIERILTEIDRLDEIARAFSRYGSAPEDRPQPIPTDVAEVCHDIVALEQMGADSGIAWELRGVDGPVLALARADELKDVLLNLLENSRLAEATVVTVRVHRDAETDGEDGRGWVSITVTDNGKGIPSTALPRIFEPHFSTRTSGSGLGLPISRRIIDGWGGEMRVESDAGHGTTMTIRLRAP